MAIAVKKYNPGFLTDDEIIESFCVRTHEFESIDESLREMGSSSSTHSLVIGPRGSGKTHLLLRVAAEVRHDPDLSAIFPVVFAEESYEVGTCGEFWLECLGHLAEQAPEDEQASLRLTYDDLRTVSDDRMLAERCLGSLLDFADRHDTRLLLVVENLNMLFSDMSDPDAGWQLRKTLQTEPRIILLGSATSRFDEIDSPEYALYDLFRVLTLRPLDTAECEALWETVSGKPTVGDTVRPLEILTGGSPRLIAIIARFGADRSFADLMNNLLDMVDEHTEYFKSHLEALPSQERRVYLALARLWKPTTAREVAEQARLDTNACSAQLRRLVERGVVAIEGGTPRRRRYYLTERLYNIYYLLRRGAGADRLVRALIEFMICIYSPSELSKIIKSLVQGALVPDLLRNVPYQLTETLINEALALEEEGRDAEAYEIYSEMIDELGQHSIIEYGSDLFMAFLGKSGLLGKMGHIREAIAVCDDLLELVGTRRDGTLPLVAASALHRKVRLLLDDSDHETALEACDRALVSIDEDKSTGPLICHATAFILYSKAIVLTHSECPVEAVSTLDQAVQRCGRSPKGNLAEMAAYSLVFKVGLLTRMDQTISESEVSLLLECLAECSEFPPLTINAVVELIVSVGTSRTLYLIQKSPAPEMLLPVVTALQLELGQSPQVAKEVLDVAHDFQRVLLEGRVALESRTTTNSPTLKVGDQESDLA